MSQECLEFAITTNQEYGVWGGHSEEERRIVRRKWRAHQRGAQKVTAAS
ncbi:MAG: WhiB family transcriptional regulator [Acidimicrobiales bacterium]